ncbi:MAG: hypothetical protein JO235_16420 [Chroococcidiopsidaceae cyanobacterium CP_BM_RX_35]|nr:hypothetical protein [Chroococcidiopsidaceae cyanobacterium CP_BM_RX_35]
MNQPNFDRDLDRIISKTDRILKHLETATTALNGKGGSIEEMAFSVRSAHQIAIDLRDSLPTGVGQ